MTREKFLTVKLGSCYVGKLSGCVMNERSAGQERRELLDQGNWMKQQCVISFSICLVNLSFNLRQN